ncbi:PIN domain-containing protein [Streptomyces sp. NPDC058947]|uniref:PIN domain-containing protein n=1 Tax=Streptomyces sp. NPDC058947 TaxID=3346675 RepID=UPI0036C5BDE4
MIILDTSILRSISPESSSANLLHAISVAADETIALPWMVREELAAQQAIKYESMHAKAVEALDALRRTAPWEDTPEIGVGEVELHREYWREKWTPPLNVIPTSESALREGMYREANLLPPCRLVKDIKTGARDTAIWLSAVEYAREHPDETVFFVSANTKDFGDGSSPLPFPMDRDIVGMEDRFRILTSMEELAADFTEPAEITAEAAAEALDTPGVRQAIAHESLARFSLMRFVATVPLNELYDHVTTRGAEEWKVLEANVGTVDDVQGYRIGQQEWCTATVVWHLVGSLHSVMGYVFGAVSWTTTVLFNLSGDPNLTVVRAEAPVPASADVVNELGVPTPDLSTVEAALTDLRREKALATYRLLEEQHAQNVQQPVGLPRAYSGALKRRAATRRHPRPSDG